MLRKEEAWLEGGSIVGPVSQVERLGPIDYLTASMLHATVLGENGEDVVRRAVKYADTQKNAALRGDMSYAMLLQSCGQYVGSGDEPDAANQCRSFLADFRKERPREDGQTPTTIDVDLAKARLLDRAKNACLTCAFDGCLKVEKHPRHFNRAAQCRF